MSCSHTCKTCSGNSQKCLSCNDGFYMDNTQATPTCLGCQNDCKTCNSSPTSCTSCFDGYFLNAANNLCQPCDQKCLLCSNTSTNCNSCIDGYYVLNNTCQICDKPCKTCQNLSTKCTSCYNNYSLDSTQFKCNLCSNLCKTCDGLTGLCTSCLDGYSLISGQCQLCQFPCSTCASGNVNLCLSCSGNYYLDTILNICSICSNNCVSCVSQSNCSKCQNGYILDANNQCIACSQTCKTCSNQFNQCLSCFDGYYFDNLNKVCSPCIPGCKQCNNLTSCNVGQCFDPYFYDTTSQTCLQCSPQCLSCTGNNNCTTCEDGYVLISGSCVQCDQDCRKCSQSTDNCTDCYQNFKLVQFFRSYCYQKYSCSCSLTKGVCNSYSYNDCVCMQGYYKVSSNACNKCIQHCQDCTDGSTCTNCFPPYVKTNLNTCVLNKCDSTQYFDGSQCQFCPPGCLTCTSNQICTSCIKSYYLQTQANGNIQCLPCKYPCDTCDNETSCISCLPNFILSNSKSCQNLQNCKSTDSNSKCSTCIDKFYLDSTCQPCGILCQTCNNSNSCLTCIPGYYLDSQNQCQPCNFNCLTCLDQNACTSCFDQGISRDVPPQCLCKSGYFQLGSQNKCSQCDPTCQQCSNLSTNCSACDASKFRILIPGGQCICQQGYYEIFQPYRQCLACDPTCLECYGSGPQRCLSCKSGFYLNPLYTSCQCQQGQFLNSNGVCQSCQVGCILCQNQSQCLQCGLNMQISQDKTTCSCLKGYYQNQGVCQQCDVAFCEDCSANKSQCLKCFSGTLQSSIISKCECSSSSSNQFISNLMSCSLCHFSCATCDGFEAHNCITCLSSRKYNSVTSTCECKDGTYEDDASQNCFKCHYSCFKCNGPFESDCIECPQSSTTFRQISANRQPQDISFRCTCAPGYFDVTQQQICQKCSYQCLTCIGFASNCQSCQVTMNRVLSSINTCICSSGYFDDGFNFQCQKCHYTCKKCINGTKSGCIECPDNSFRYSSYKTLTVDNSFECLCNERYYDDGINPVCQKCHYSCKNCIGPKNTDCIQCDQVIVYQRMFIANISSPISSTGICQCVDGYFDDLTNILCQKCPYQCKTCDIQKCLTCDITRDLVGMTCQCKKGYLEVGNQACDSCSPLCSECSQTRYKCTACNTAITFRQLNQQNSCLCQEGYFDASKYDSKTRIPILEIPNCLKCKKNCKSCGPENPNICLSCYSNYNYVLNPEDLCVCMFGFEENNSICEEKFLVNNSYIDESKLDAIKSIIQTLLRIIKVLSWIHLLMNQPFQSLLGFRLNLMLIYLNFCSVKVSKIIQNVTELQEIEDPFSIFNFMNFISPSYEEVNKRNLLNKRIFLQNKPTSFLQNGQGYFFLFILVLFIYLILKLTVLRKSVLISSKIYRKQKWRYQIYQIDHNIIFPLFMTLLQVLMIKIFFFSLVDILTTQSFSYPGSAISLIALIIYGIAYISCIVFLYLINKNEENKLKKFFEYDLNPNSANFFFLQFSIDILICAYYVVQSTDFKQQTIIIILGYFALGFFALIQKPFKHYWENYLEFIYYAGLSTVVILFQQVGQLTLTQLMNDNQQKQFNTSSFYLDYSLIVALIISIACITIKLSKGIIRIMIFIKKIREFNQSDTALWEVEILETEKIITQHRKSLLITDQQQINKNILKEIMNSDLNRKETNSTQHMQTITLTPRTPGKRYHL
ncbi:LA domain protein (macronuclear) [Tetrahymena thermophila SB210]|uniref:LA domain protein n=1 Tax=Tetrahymena thermophila (strain SB210) TaxID=312017 RepID=I7LW92_TETTS|nr:LA domain protein [Tetrahymena thermophila SB210]EAS01190.2 LA domain protein [Tetrahymena thermophila SB210]|eukprot:XP_001021435.2 LA domain protein [Tetrahymena thermophila SB210]